MTFPAEIETERLLLKAVTPAVIHEAFRTLPPAAIRQVFGVDDAGFEHLRSMHEGGMETFRISAFHFLIHEKSSGLPVGDCGFHTWNRTHHRAELFYALRTDAFKRKGYMTEALPPVIAYGFTQLHLHRIEVLVASWNTPSVRLIEKNGFIKEGTRRQDYLQDGSFDDSESYSMLKPEWEQRRR